MNRPSPKFPAFRIVRVFLFLCGLVVAAITVFGVYSAITGFLDVQAIAKNHHRRLAAQDTLQKIEAAIYDGSLGQVLPNEGVGVVQLDEVFRDEIERLQKLGLRDPQFHYLAYGNSLLLFWPGGWAFESLPSNPSLFENPSELNAFRYDITNGIASSGIEFIVIERTGNRGNRDRIIN